MLSSGDCGSRILRTRKPLGTQSPKPWEFLDFSKFELNIKSWKLVSTDTLHPEHGNFGF